MIVNRIVLGVVAYRADVRQCGEVEDVLNGRLAWVDWRRLD